jgi:hypothetical protein
MEHRHSRPVIRATTPMAILLFLAASGPGCGHWRTAKTVAGATPPVAVGDTLRLRRGDEHRTVRVVRLQYPRIEGVEDAPNGPAATVLDLTTFDEVAVYDFPRGVALTSLATVGVLLLVASVSAGIACSQTRCLGGD